MPFQTDPFSITMYIFTALSIISFLLSIYFLIKTIIFLQKGVNKSVIITDLKTKSYFSDDGTDTIEAKISFKLDKKEYSLKDNFINKCPYKKGDLITVKHLPEAPETAKLNNFKSIWNNFFLTFLFGLLFSIGPIINFTKI